MLGPRTGGSMQCMLCSRSAVSCRALTPRSCHVSPGGICVLSTAKYTHGISGLRPGKHAKIESKPTPSLRLVKLNYSAMLKQ